MFCLIALGTLIVSATCLLGAFVLLRRVRIFKVLGANFAVNRKFAYEGNIKYGAFDEDDAGALGKRNACVCHVRSLL